MIKLYIQLRQYPPFISLLFVRERLIIDLSLMFPELTPKHLISDIHALQHHFILSESASLIGQYISNLA